ncbi:hypothetical protein M422DRAFT_260901 [Sphaerobolus stellatus SS14]|uniref:Uncharacterized protein n=1 Tax=Sphaerobolus stellatus (strain SS14) TaxID=990650 RepID=A0A0C9VHJ3_SPHS4|nr:hypothetical protein M422DRAFT_260901 [Sphaerobolus stellatus SS14]
MSCNINKNLFQLPPCPTIPVKFALPDPRATGSLSAPIVVPEKSKRNCYFIRNMPPGTLHWVLSVTQCLAEGGHYYLKPCFYKSFLIGLQECRLEDMETNTSHVMAENILHGILAAYYTEFDSKFGEFILDEQEPESMDTAVFENMVKGWPDPLNMAALLAMTVHAVAFEPAQMKDSAPYDFPRAVYEARTVSRQRAEYLLKHYPALQKPMARLEKEIALDFELEANYRIKAKLPPSILASFFEPLIKNK